MTRPRAALVAFALLPAFSACGSSDDSRGASELGVEAGAPAATAPDGGIAQVAFERFDGTTGSFAEYSGRPVVVNFFASWCAPCVRELPDIEQVHQALGAEVAFVGVSVNERAEDGLELAERTGITFDVVRDPRSETLRALGGAAMPTTALVDASGRVVDVRSLPYKSAEELEAKVREKLLP